MEYPVAVVSSNIHSHITIQITASFYPNLDGVVHFGGALCRNVEL